MRHLHVKNTKIARRRKDEVPCTMMITIENDGRGCHPGNVRNLKIE
jgi:hypothetical protein